MAIGVTSFSQVLEPPRDGLFDKVHTPSRRVVPYASLREADVMWAKRIWRKIDLREKQNQTIFYPPEPTNGRNSLINIIRDAIITDNTLIAYDPFLDDFKVPLTAAEVASKGAGLDTVEVQDPNPPYDIIQKAVERPFNPANVKQYLVKEDWFFDKQRSVMDVRILGICPVMEVYKDGEFRGVSNMFWVYFPDLRYVLINEEIYNPYNFGQTITYEDVFMQRRFSSFIYKEDNVFDRRIEDYMTGIDALLEAEEIKNKIRLWESELWEE